MIRIVHAAAIAVASIALAATAAIASPPAPEAASVSVMVADHGAASLAESDLGLNDSQSSPSSSGTAGPVASFIQHAAAWISGDEAGSVGPAAPVRRLADLVADHSGIQISDSEQECLAGAVYFEARSEPIEGQLAVAEVVLNRAASGRYPPSICKVVTQPAQFSFIRNGRFPRADRNSEAWRKAVAIAHIARAELADTVASNVLWYHATYVSPSWGRRLTRTAQIGLHIFYS